MRTISTVVKIKTFSDTRYWMLRQSRMFWDKSVDNFVAEIGFLDKIVLNGQTMFSPALVDDGWISHIDVIQI